MKKWLVAIFALVGLSMALALESNEEITVLQGLQEDENFTTLVSLLDSSGLAADLEAAGDLTLFAPTNEAFDALGSDTLTSLSGDSEMLTQVLQLHVLQGAYAVLDLSNAEEGSLSSLSGEPYVIAQTAGGLTVNDANLVATDVDNVYSNGVVHVVSNVLLPPDMLAQADTNQDGVVDAADAAAGAAVAGLTDVNADGVIDANDIADSNGDGVVDATDFAAAGITDTNGDGVVDEADLVVADTTTDTTTDTATTDTTDSTNTDAMTTLTDSNGDGMVDLADVTDTNNDGVVDDLDYTAVGLTDANGDGVIDEADLTSGDVAAGDESTTSGEVAAGGASTTLISDSDENGTQNCEDGEDGIDSDGDGADADQCRAE